MKWLNKLFLTPFSKDRLQTHTTTGPPAEDAQRESASQSMLDPNEEIRREIERHKRRAEDIGVKDAAAILAEHVLSYPAWIEKCREAVPETIISATRTERDAEKGGASRTDGCEIHLLLHNGRELKVISQHTHYLFDEYAHYDSIEIHFDGALVFGITTCMSDYDRYDRGCDAWQGCLVTAFIEGVWVQDVLAIADWHKARDKRLKEEAEAARLNQEKKRFGL